MVFDWDDRKNGANIHKHGISFELASRVFFDEDRIEYYDEEHSCPGEDRFITIGTIIGSLIVVTVVYTERNDRLRIISARKATRAEEEAYYHGRI